MPSPEIERHALLDHLGLPFYYRHTPTPAVRRAMFWFFFLLLAGVVLLNEILLPFAPGSFAHNVRVALFGRHAGYETFEQGLRSLCNQMFALGILLSAFIAPLFATFALCSERVTGTLEFLRLAPFSTPAIILGKLFAAPHRLLLASGILLLLGVAAGWAGGYPPEGLALALLAVVLSAVTLHLAGGVWATLTAQFRGFAAVLGLLIVLLAFHLAPLGFSGEDGMRFLAGLSPWSALDDQIWQVKRGDYGGAPQFLGVASLVPVYVLAAHLVVQVLLLWAACRKLEIPELPALPRRGWLILWGLTALTALGILFNPVPSRRWNPTGASAEYATAFFLVTAGVTCVLALLDHPHHRETALTRECERCAAGRGGYLPHLRELQQVLFVAGLVFLTSALGAHLLTQADPASFAWDSPVVLALALSPPLVALAAALCVEGAAMTFASLWLKIAAGAVALAFVAAALIAPAVHVASVHDDWSSAYYAAKNYYDWVGRGSPANTPAYYSPDSQMQRVRKRPGYAPFLADMDSLAACNEAQRLYRDDPVRCFTHYRPLALTSYALALLALAVGLLFWRQLAYLLLYREARRATAS